VALVTGNRSSPCSRMRSDGRPRSTGPPLTALTVKWLPPTATWARMLRTLPGNDSCSWAACRQAFSLTNGQVPAVRRGPARMTSAHVRGPDVVSPRTGERAVPL